MDTGQLTRCRAYEVADNDLAFASAGWSSRYGCFASRLSGANYLLDAPNRSGSGCSGLRAGCRATWAWMTRRLTAALENLVERLIQLASHCSCRSLRGFSGVDSAVAW